MSWWRTKRGPDGKTYITTSGLQLWRRWPVVVILCVLVLLFGLLVPLLAWLFP